MGIDRDRAHGAWTAEVRRLDWPACRVESEVPQQYAARPIAKTQSSADLTAGADQKQVAGERFRHLDTVGRDDRLGDDRVARRDEVGRVLR
jgi:hypothetical protein